MCTAWPLNNSLGGKATPELTDLAGARYPTRAHRISNGRANCQLKECGVLRADSYACSDSDGGPLNVSQDGRSPMSKYGIFSVNQRLALSLGCQRAASSRQRQRRRRIRSISGIDHFRMDTLLSSSVFPGSSTWIECVAFRHMRRANVPDSNGIQVNSVLATDGGCPDNCAMPR